MSHVYIFPLTELSDFTLPTNKGSWKPLVTNLTSTFCYLPSSIPVALKAAAKTVEGPRGRGMH